MTKNSAEKKAVRAYQAAHPGMTYPQAQREQRAEYRAQRAANPATADPDCTCERRHRGTCR